MTVQEQIVQAVTELCDVAKLQPEHILVVGCSTSEVRGSKIGTDSAPATGEELVEAILSVLEPRGIFLAAQCCEHLNRCLILERAAAPGLEPVNVVPQPKAGGSFATAAYRRFRDPVAVEHIRAQAGMDIGGTLIGMHLREVAVPVRLGLKAIGQAPLTAARTRPKFVGGVRAVYDESLL